MQWHAPSSFALATHMPAGLWWSVTMSRQLKRPSSSCTRPSVSTSSTTRSCWVTHRAHQVGAWSTGGLSYVMLIQARWTLSTQPMASHPCLGQSQACLQKWSGLKHIFKMPCHVQQTCMSCSNKLWEPTHPQTYCIQFKELHRVSVSWAAANLRLEESKCRLQRITQLPFYILSANTSPSAAWYSNVQIRQIMRVDMHGLNFKRYFYLQGIDTFGVMRSLAEDWNPHECHDRVIAEFKHEWEVPIARPNSNSSFNHDLIGVDFIICWTFRFPGQPSCFEDRQAAIHYLEQANADPGKAARIIDKEGCTGRICQSYSNHQGQRIEVPERLHGFAFLIDDIRDSSGDVLVPDKHCMGHNIVWVVSLKGLMEATFNQQPLSRMTWSAPASASSSAALSASQSTTALASSLPSCKAICMRRGSGQQYGMRAAACPPWKTRWRQLSPCRPCLTPSQRVQQRRQLSSLRAAVAACPPSSRHSLLL